MQVRPHPQDASVTNFPIRNLATVPVATVAHILKYIMDYPSLDKRGTHYDYCDLVYLCNYNSPSF